MDGFRDIEPRRPADYSAIIDSFTDARVSVWRRRGGYCIVKVTEWTPFGDDTRREDRPGPPRGLSPAALLDQYESWGREVCAAMRTSRPYRRRPELAAAG